MSVNPVAARSTRAVAAIVAALVLSACAGLRSKPEPAPAPEPLPSTPRVRMLEVTATAYNSTQAQTDADSTLTAFGVRLRPGMRIVAVSRDLEALGVTEGVKIRIDGQEGEWEVGDRLARRWSRRIDLYMGDDIGAARAWGRRKVTIRW